MRAKENGYTEEAEDWANMGQGAPEWYVHSLLDCSS